MDGILHRLRSWLRGRPQLTPTPERAPAAAATKPKKEGAEEPDTGVSRWLMTLAPAVATVLSAVSGLVAAVLSGASGSQQFFVNEFWWVVATILGFALGTLVCVYGMFIKHPRDTEPEKEARTRWLGVGIIILLGATVIGGLTLVRGHSVQQQPQVAVSFDDATQTLSATVTSSGLIASRRVTVAVLGYYDLQECVYLYRSDVGPKPDGSVNVDLSVQIPQRTFARAVVVAWTRVLSSLDAAAASAPPIATPTLRLVTPCRNPAARTAVDDRDPLPDCRTPFAEQEFFSCAQVRLEGTFNRVAQLAASADGAGVSRTLGVEANAYLLPWDSLLLTVRNEGALLYQGRLVPNQDGIVDATVEVAIGADEQNVCVTALLYTPTDPAAAHTCPAMPGAGDQYLAWLIVHQPASVDAPPSPAPATSPEATTVPLVPSPSELPGQTAAPGETPGTSP